jgi:hypothetical protein
VPSYVVSKSGSCPKSSLKQTAMKTPSRSDNLKWFKTVVELRRTRSKNDPVGFKGCHVDKRTFFGVSKTRTCDHLHSSYKEALECSYRMRVGK